MKKLSVSLLFTFFNRERHKFLLGKWWFRLAIVVYLIILVVAPFVAWLKYMNYETGWCYDSLSYYYNDTQAFNQHLDQCQQLARGLWKQAIGFAILSVLVVHYLVQFTFFKIFIDFIYLGAKKV